MTVRTVNRFSGSTPRLAPHLLGDAAAGVALDCKFWHGTLDSWREPLLAHTTVEGTRSSILFDCCWLDFDSCVDTALGPVTCRQLFATGLSDYPYPVSIEFPDPEAPCEPLIRRLGVPCGDAAPEVLAGARDPARSADKDIEGRTYAYQYVNATGLRGALSRASQAQLLYDGQSVVISGWPVPDASWGVTSVAIYRAVSSTGVSMSQIAADNAADTTWMEVGVVPIGAVSFTDSKYNDELLNALEEDVVLPPPDGLRGIVHVSSMNSLAGFVGNRIYFSENNSYHDWPYYHDLDDNICGIVENNGAVYVATDGAPYVLQAAVDCKNAGCRQPTKLPVKYPMVGCGNRRMAALPQGVVYPSHDGLVALSGNNAPTLLTHALYAQDDWHALFPETVTPVAHGGKLFVFARGGSFVLTLAGGSEASWPLDSHSSLSDVDVLDAFTSRNGDLYLVKPLGVWQWDRGDTIRPHQWTSPEWVTPVPTNFGASHMWFKNGAEQVTFEVDGREILDRPVYSSRVFRLPNWAVGTRWQVTIKGTGQVSLFSMATSMKELSA